MVKMIEGGVYRRRDEVIVRVRRNANGSFPWKCGKKTYTDEGMFFQHMPFELDLVELIATTEQIQAASDWLETGQCYGLADHAPVLKSILEMLK
jgi:hypothetical protein